MASFGPRTYGYVNSGTSEGYAIVLENYARSYSENQNSAHMWAVTLRGRVGRVSAVEGNPSFRFVIWENNSSYEPTTTRAYGEEETSSTDLTSGSTGAVYTSDIVSAAGSPTNDSAQLWAGKSYSLGIQSDHADLHVAMIFAASISKVNENIYQRQSAENATIPPSTFGTASVAYGQGHLTVWTEGYANEPPRVPVDRVPSGTISDATPTFTSTFRDRNGAWGTANSGYDSGDVINRYRIQVRRVSDETIMWAPSSFSATSTEKTNNATSKVYAGSALSLGTTYEWRIQHQDMFEEWGDYSDWLEFTPAQAGYVFTNASSPTGKQEVITGITFGGSWTHQSSTSTNAVQVRIKENGTVVQTSGTITKTVVSAVSPGTAFTVSWADTGFSSLDWGRNYTYEIRARDTSNVWSDWSDGRAFNTNASPSTPSNLIPSNGSTSTSYPLLRCSASDPDSDDDGASLTVKAIITRPNLSTVTVTLPYVSGEYQYQTTGTEITATGTYSWVAYSYDGTLYSGEQTVEANADKSSAGTFVYATGPTVTITSPTEAEVIETIDPTITFSVSGGTQVEYRVIITQVSDSAVAYDSGWVVDTATSHDVPLGYLDNETEYTLVVQVEDNLALIGISGERAFEIDYPPVPALTNFQANPMQVTTDTVPSAIRLTWDASIEPAPWFVRYILRRSDLTNPLAYISSQSQTEYVDYLPVSGESYTYTIRQVNVIDGLNLAGPTVSAEASIDLEGVVLCSVTSPSTLRANLSFGESRSHRFTNNDQIYLPWGATKPTTVRGNIKYWTTSGRYKLIDDNRIGVTAAQRVQELEDILNSGNILCYRDSRGRKRFVVPEREGTEFSDEFFLQSEVTLALREEAYEEGES
jgi:hypothetical protein